MILRPLLDWLRYARQRLALNPEHALGCRGEDLVHRHLQRRGYLVIARNFVPRNGHGDIDLIARKDGRLIIVEVKTRTSADISDPSRAIHAEKVRRLTRAGREYARRTGTPWEQVRFDTISIVLRPRVRLDHEEDVISLR